MAPLGLLLLTSQTILTNEEKESQIFSSIPDNKNPNKIMINQFDSAGNSIYLNTGPALGRWGGATCLVVVS